MTHEIPLWMFDAFVWLVLPSLFGLVALAAVEAWRRLWARRIVRQSLSRRVRS